MQNKFCTPKNFKINFVLMQNKFCTPKNFKINFVLQKSKINFALQFIAS
jgi:hypothetical protein